MSLKSTLYAVKGTHIVKTIPVSCPAPVIPETIYGSLSCGKDNIYFLAKGDYDYIYLYNVKILKEQVYEMLTMKREDKPWVIIEVLLNCNGKTPFSLIESLDNYGKID